MPSFLDALKYGLLPWLFWAWIFLFFPAPAPALQTIGDVTTDSPNTTDYTSYVYWKNIGPPGEFWAGIFIGDATVYSPAQTFTNSGNLTLGTLNNFSDVMVGIGNDNTSVHLVNSGTIEITYMTINRDIDFYGIETDGSLENTGAVTLITAQSGTLDNNVTGLYGGGATLVNAGAIQLDVQNGSGTTVFRDFPATGIRFLGTQLTNSGNISISLQGVEVNGFSMSNTIANGISSDGGVHNTGDITISVRGSHVTGTVLTYNDTHGKGIIANGNLTHTGTIQVTATGGKYRTNSSSPYVSDDALAYGIEMAATGTLDSRGLITANALPSPGLSGGSQTAYQVHVSGGDTTITGYAMELVDNAQLSADYQHVISTGSGATATFSNATLYLHVDANFTGHGEFHIPTLVDGAAVGDQFTQVQGAPSDYNAVLKNGNGTQPQTLELTYAPRQSPPAVNPQIQNTFNAQGHRMVESRIMDQMLHQRADLEPAPFLHLSAPQGLIQALGPKEALPSAIDWTPDHTLFITPLYLKAENDSSPGYEAESRGLVIGGTRTLSPDLRLGVHGSLHHVDVDYTGTGIQGRFDDMDSGSLGAHALYQPHENWLVTGIASLFHSRTRYWDTDVDNRESAAYHTWAGRVDTRVGYLFEHNRQILMPQVGLSWAWFQRDAFTTDNRSGPDVSYGRLEEQQLYGELGVKWYGTVDLSEEWTLKGFAGTGVLQTLSNGKFSNTMSVGTALTTYTHTPDKTLLHAEAGLEISKGDISLGLGYSGEISDHNQNDLVWLKVGFRF